MGVKCYFYETVESVLDTTINGKVCQKVVCPPAGGYYYVSTGIKYVYSNADTIFIYDKHLQEFSIYQVFNAQVGDEWDFYFANIYDIPIQFTDTIHFTVDSNSYEYINGDTLRVVHTTAENNCDPQLLPSINMSFIERIGDLFFLFPNDCNPLVDINFLGNLRCYSDPIFGSYETGIVDSCYWVNDPSSVTKINSENAVELWPNPANNELNIQLTSTIDELAIYNINGKLVKPINVTLTQNQSLTIDITDLPTGIYSLVGLSNQETIKAKFVKH